MKKLLSIVMVMSLLIATFSVGIYANDKESLKADVSVIKGNGRIIYDVKENGLHDIVIIEDNGDIILNGDPVEITTNVTLDSGIMPRATYTAVVDAPPAGTTADDYYIVTDIRNATIQLEDEIRTYTYTGLAAVFYAAFYQTHPDITPDMWYDFLVAIEELLTGQYCYSSAVSAIITTYQYKDGRMVSNDTDAVKLNLTCYADANYSNYVGMDTMYIIWVYR